MSKPTTDSIIHDLKILQNYPNPHERSYILRIAAERLEELENENAELRKKLADVVPVVHGRWIDDPVAGPICPACGGKVWKWTRGRKSPCCPNCGARMDGEEEP